MMLGFFCRAIFFIILLFSVFGHVYAGNGPPIRLEKAKINLSDRAALLRGAAFYAQNCMVCHTMRYLAHNKLAQEAGITLDKMPLKQTEWWLNIVPPDLSLIARQRSADWIYTYLVSFYKDPARPTGYNNLVAKDINMPNLFAAMQGEQVLTEHGKQLLAAGKFRKPPYYRVLESVKAGSMTPEQFDQVVSDLVNFFVYASDPSRLFRIYLGIGTMIFLIIFFVLALLLKKVYWKQVKKGGRRLG